MRIGDGDEEPVGSGLLGHANLGGTAVVRPHDRTGNGGGLPLCVAPFAAIAALLANLPPKDERIVFRVAVASGHSTHLSCGEFSAG
ncbi:MAG: hypothetical protein ACK56I_01220, partial [bacterium]